MMGKEEFIKAVKGGLIVSCQAVPGEPLYQPQGGIMPLMAKAAWEAGAVGIRTSSVKDVSDIVKDIPLPVIGLIKEHYEGYEAYITPTMKEVDALVKIGCEVIAIDFTKNSRPDYPDAASFIRAVKEKYPNQMLMADCSSLQDALRAEEAGVDFVGTTMSGYVQGDEAMDGPNFELAEQIVKRVHVPLIAEGRIHTPEQAKKMLEIGAFAVVVGGAITRPKEITARFIKGISK